VHNNGACTNFYILRCKNWYMCSHGVFSHTCTGDNSQELLESIPQWSWLLSVGETFGTCHMNCNGAICQVRFDDNRFEGLRSGSFRLERFRVAFTKNKPANVDAERPSKVTVNLYHDSLCDIGPDPSEYCIRYTHPQFRSRAG
jgi:hypothetical protein